MKKTLLFLCLLCATLSGKAAQSDVVTSNPFGRSLTFTDSGSYGWTYDSTNKRLQSTNKGVNNSTSITTITIGTSVDCPYSAARSSLKRIYFRYGVSSESGYDKLTIKINDVVVVNGISGKKEDNVIYTDENQYKNTVIELSYTKDGSESSNDDVAYISGLSILPTGYCGKDNLKDALWVLSEDGNLSISGTGKIKGCYHDTDSWDAYYGTFSGHNVPCDYVDGLGDLIYNIQILEGITGIGDYAFAGSNVVNVSLPNSLEDLGNYSFLDCKNLNAITIPSSVKSGNPFSGCYFMYGLFINNSTTWNYTPAYYDQKTEERVVIKDNKVVSCNTLCKNAFIPSIYY